MRRDEFSFSLQLEKLLFVSGERAEEKERSLKNRDCACKEEKSDSVRPINVAFPDHLVL